MKLFRYLAALALLLATPLVAEAQVVNFTPYVYNADGRPVTPQFGVVYDPTLATSTAPITARPYYRGSPKDPNAFILINPDGTAWGASSSIAANSVLGNATASPATGVSLAMTSCSGVKQAVIWTANVGFGCNSNLGRIDQTNTWTSTQTFTVAPVFTDASGTRTALGLGNSATLNVGTIASTVAAGDDNRFYSRGYIDGCTLSTAGASTSFGVSICYTTGNATPGNMVRIAVNTAYTKTTGAWAVGTGNGCLDTGTIAVNTWYNIFAIIRTDTGVTDYICSTAASPSLPSPYSQARLLGSLRTNGSSQWLKFVQVGEHFLWDVGSLDMNNAAITATATSQTLLVPPGRKVLARVRLTFYGAAGQSYLLLSSLDESDQTAGLGNATASHNTAASSATGGVADVMTNQSSQIRVKADAASRNLYLMTYGWVDPRGTDQ